MSSPTNTAALVEHMLAEIDACHARIGTLNAAVIALSIHATRDQREHAARLIRVAAANHRPGDVLATLPGAADASRAAAARGAERLIEALAIDVPATGAGATVLPFPGAGAGDR